MSTDIERKNNRLGLALFALAMLLFVGAIVVAEIYVRVEG